MAAPSLDVDWDAIRAHAVVFGVREAARAFGVNENTALARSYDEEWLKDVRELAKPHQEALPRSMQGKAIKAIKPADAARSSLERLGDRSRINLARYVVKGSREAAKLKGDKLFTNAPSVKAIADVGKTAFRWQDQPNTPLVNINLLGAQLPQAP